MNLNLSSASLPSVAVVVLVLLFVLFTCLGVMRWLRPRSGRRDAGLVGVRAWNRFVKRLRAAASCCRAAIWRVGRIQRGATTAAARTRGRVATGRGEERAVHELLSQIVEVNAALHARLAWAEGTLANQAAELDTYKSEARTDALTGLANRRAFDESLQGRMLAGCSNHRCVAVMLVDIDRFKWLNDQFGHQAGDAVLAQCAQVLSDAMSDQECVARIGGEEFAVIFAAARAPAARAYAERARQRIEEAEFQGAGKRLQVTVSIGVAASQDGESTVSLLQRVDEALYASKSAGRNRAHWHDGQRAMPLRARPADPNRTVARTTSRTST